MDIEKKHKVLVVAASAYAWFVLTAAAGLIYSVIDSFTLLALREVLVAAVMLYPVKYMFPVEELPGKIESWLEEKKTAVILSVLVSTSLYVLLDTGADLFLLDHYSILHYSLTSAFLKAEVLYTGIFGEVFSNGIYTGSVLYLETMIAYSVIDPVNRKISEVRKDG
ncbi:MAG: hypothetical protein ABEJ36_04740 [Candidatus Nanosalina sp.]